MLLDLWPAVRTSAETQPAGGTALVEPPLRAPSVIHVEHGAIRLLLVLSGQTRVRAGGRTAPVHTHLHGAAGATRTAGTLNVGSTLDLDSNVRTQGVAPTFAAVPLAGRVTLAATVTTTARADRDATQMAARYGDPDRDVLWLLAGLPPDLS